MPSAAWLEVLPVRQIVSAKDVLQKVKRLIMSSKMSEAISIIDKLIGNQAVANVPIDVAHWGEACKPTPASGHDVAQDQHEEASEDEAIPVKKKVWGHFLGWRHFAKRRVGRRALSPDSDGASSRGTSGGSAPRRLFGRSPFFVEAESHAENSKAKFEETHPTFFDDMLDVDAPQDINAIINAALQEIAVPEGDGVNMFLAMHSLPDPCY
eukprot:TRINITY_DN3581_c1_g1_i1.p1 TRINITY_DN3581_c1_g1~~TRINITY_DN3581_c1_g1_i1.p1  ORF type:complete len:210 (+),score=37.98 TRINITY_DN3581_c1_g1_i1:98-727(+)